jgi:predicted site-specific integrase-resolvase
MTSLKSLDDAPKTVKVSRRQLQRWISEGRITRYKSEGDRKVYVDLDEVRDLRKPKPVPPKPKSK